MNLTKANFFLTIAGTIAINILNLVINVIIVVITLKFMGVLP